MAPEAKPVEMHVVAVRCPRLGCMRTVAEHRECPYCYGPEQAIATADRRCFCDYRPQVDATTFGFPEEFGRYAW